MHQTTQIINKAFKLCPNEITKPLFEVDADLKEKLGKDYRLLPEFEKSVYEHLYKKHYSLGRNEKMKCRWIEYKNYFPEHVKAPVHFPHVRDQHFNHNMVRYKPSISIFRKTDYKKKMKVGPGVDEGGQLPIPQELLMKRGVPQDKTQGLRKIKDKSKTAALAENARDNENNCKNKIKTTTK